MSNKAQVPKDGFSLQLKPVGCACNIKCDYCYVEPFRFKNGKQIFETMSSKVLHATLKSCLDFAAHPTITWHGGEPMLAGLDFFNQAVGFIEELKKPGQSVYNVIQTNATLITPEFAEFFKSSDFEVSVSIDGPEKVHGIHRKDFSQNNTFARTMRGVKMLRESGISPAVIATVDQISRPFAKEVFHFLVDNGFTDIKYSPVYDREKDQFNLSSRLWYGYLNTVFHEWFFLMREDIHVRELDEVISWIANETPLNLCSSNRTCLMWVSVDPNGNLYPCEYLRQTHPYGNIMSMELADIPRTAGYQDFYHTFLDFPKKCRQCQFLPLCGNGCPATRVKNSKLSFDGTYVYCRQRCDLFELIKGKFEEALACEEGGETGK